MNAAYRFGLKLASPYRIPGKPLVDEASVLADRWGGLKALWSKHRGNRFMNIPDTRAGAMALAANPHVGARFPGPSEHGGLDWNWSHGQKAYDDMRHAEYLRTGNFPPRSNG